MLLFGFFAPSGMLRMLAASFHKLNSWNHTVINAHRVWLISIEVTGNCMTCYLNIALWISVMEALEQWESSVIILASTRPDRQKWEHIQQEENTGASTGQNGWMETSVLGLNSGTSMQCKDSEADFSLPEGHVLKYGKTLWSFHFLTISRNALTIKYKIKVCFTCFFSSFKVLFMHYRSSTTFFNTALLKANIFLHKTLKANIFSTEFLGFINSFDNL